MLTLNELLRLICQRTSVHICIHDISGILEQERLRIDSEFKTHTKPFCNAAKSTVEGFSACISCKDSSNRRAARNEDFSRVCPYGMWEIVRPVEISGKVRCIVYLGNIAKNHLELSESVESFCNSIGISSSAVLSYVKDAEFAKDGTLSTGGYYLRLADFIRDFIIELYDTRQTPKHERRSLKNEHWCVRQVCEYIEMNLTSSITLSSIARLYFINEKYLGRLFKMQTGKTFHQYLTDARLDRATQLLESSGTVISVAEECGFQNVTYFNRCFKQRFGMTPSEYRQSNINL